jgi:integrase
VAGRGAVSAFRAVARVPVFWSRVAKAFAIHVAEAVSALVARENRTEQRQVFQGFGADRFRTALARACRDSAAPAFSPHDLPHRRVTLSHLQRVPAAEAASWLGHSAQEHLRTYAHATLGDRSEVDYAALLAPGMIGR